MWNAGVEASKTAHALGEDCGPARLDKMLTGWRAAHGWLAARSSVPQQQTIRDFAKSRAKALTDIRNRVPVTRRAGMPKFRRKYLAKLTLNYSRRGFRLTDNGNIRLASGIEVRPVWSRELPSVPSSIRIFRDALGHWYASAVVGVEPEPLRETHRVIGVDWGVTVIATTTSDEHDLPHPEYGRKHAERLARYQRMMARRRPSHGCKASKGYGKAKRQAAKAHIKIARQRTDTARNWAKRITADHDAVAVEDFKPKFLAKSTMARKAADAAIGATKTALIHMANKHARILRLVNPNHTTTDCASCGARAKQRLTLSERTYTCERCGVSISRDKNSAQMMLIRAGLAPIGVDRVRLDQPSVDRAA